MTKNQFIEGCLREFAERWAGDYGYCNPTVAKQISDFLQSKLSECWDEAEHQGYCRGGDDVKRIVSTMVSLNKEIKKFKQTKLLTPKQEDGK